MRPMCLTLLMIAVALAPSAAPSQDGDITSGTGLEGSKHDFSNEAWTAGDMCVACHAPKSDLPAEAPLWNPSAGFNRAFGDAVRDKKDRRALPGEGSLICLRCHDGTVAQDMFGGLAAPSGRNIRHPALLTTGHGGTDHPVGIEYPRTDREFRPASAVLSEGAVPLPGGKVECTSCHDPHNQSGTRYMLVKSNHRSALCLTCHKK